MTFINSVLLYGSRMRKTQERFSLNRLGGAGAAPLAGRWTGGRWPITWWVTGREQGMIAWMVAQLAGPILLAGFAVYVCRRPRRPRRLAREQIAEFQILADIEKYENLL